MPDNNINTLAGTFGIGLLLGIILALFLFESCERRTEPHVIYSQSVPDTVRLPAIHDTIPKIVPQLRYVPQKVYIYQTLDTARRKALEKDTLITGIKDSAGTLEIQTITPLGQELVRDYLLPMGSNTLTIDHTGNLEVTTDPATLKKEKRLKNWRKWRDRGISFALGFLGGRIKF